MRELIHQLGIDWRLLLSQAVNFLLLLIVLRIFAYKPVLKLLHDRKKRIAEAVEKANEADKRLRESNLMVKEKMKEAESEVLQIFRDAEQKGKEMEVKILGETKKKEEALIKSAEAAIENKKREMEEKVKEEAVMLVKEALKKTVEMEPEKIDEVLIKKALQQIPR